MLMSDGEDTTAKECVDEVTESGSILHFIALGPNFEYAVKNMSDLTGETQSLYYRIPIVVYEYRNDAQPYLLSFILQKSGQGLENKVKQTQPLSSLPCSSIDWKSTQNCQSKHMGHTPL